VTRSLRTAVLLNDTTVDRHHGCTTVIESIRKLADAAGISIVAAAPAHSDWQADHGFMSALEDSELVIVNGEGTIHHDRPAGMKLLTAGHFARSRGKKSALINATWQANGPESCNLAGFFDLVSVRESASKVALASHGVESRVVADLALFHHVPPADERTTITFTDSVIGSDAIEIYKKMWRVGATPISLLHGRRSMRDSVTSFRRFLGDFGFASIKNTPYALRGVGTDWRSQVMHRDEFARKVGASSLVITGRFHMVIFCLASRTPVLAVESNTHKISATLADAGLRDWRLSCVSDLDQDTLNRASHWHDGELEALDDFVSSNRQLMLTLFQDIRQL